MDSCYCKPGQLHTCLYYTVKINDACMVLALSTPCMHHLFWKYIYWIYFQYNNYRRHENNLAVLGYVSISVTNLHYTMLWAEGYSYTHAAGIKCYGYSVTQIKCYHAAGIQCSHAAEIYNVTTLGDTVLPCCMDTALPCIYTLGIQYFHSLKL